MSARAFFRPRRAARAASAALAVLGASGCLGEPPIEERWTLLEVVEGPAPAAIAPGQATPVSVKARITYREILTGSIVAEIRASDVLTADDTGFENDDDRLAMAQDVDAVLRNSVSLGFAARAVTGFDHLIQEFDLVIDAAGVPPPSLDADSTAAPTSATGLFLVLYFGDVDEVETADGEEIEVVTPFFSDEVDVLSAGVELGTSP